MDAGCWWQVSVLYHEALARAGPDRAAYLGEACAGHEFGSAVALSGDGRLMAIGAHNEDSAARGMNPPSPDGFGGTSGAQVDNAAEDSGAVYVFAF